MEATVEPAVQMKAGVRGPVERTTARRPIPLQVPAAIDVSDQATKPHPRILSSDPKGKGGTTHPKSLALFYFSIQLVIMRDAYFAALHIAMQRNARTFMSKSAELGVDFDAGRKRKTGEIRQISRRQGAASPYCH
jgi:hypothetical protein